LRNDFQILVSFSKHEIKIKNSRSRLETQDAEEKKFPFSSRKMRFLFKFLEKKGHIILRNFERKKQLFFENICH